MKFLATSALALSLAAGSASATTVDFDSVATGFVAPGTSFNGLVFDPTIDIQILSASSSSAAPGPGQTGNIARQATPPFGAVPRGGSIGGSFQGFTVSDLSIVVGDSGGDLDSFQLTGFDSSNNQIADSGLITSSAATTVTIAASGISRFFLAITGPGGASGSSFFDDIQFTQELTAIPVPAALPLFATGLAAFGLAARRRRKD